MYQVRPWRIKTFKTREAMASWLERREGLIQYDQVFIAGGFAVEWRYLRIIDID